MVLQCSTNTFDAKRKLCAYLYDVTEYIVEGMISCMPMFHEDNTFVDGVSCGRR